MSLPKCEHGVSRNDGRFVGSWNAPFSECGCCGVSFPYIDSASYGQDEHHTRSWQPKDRCEACGGRYVESHMEAQTMTHDALDRLRKEWRERLWVLRHRDLSIAEFHAMQIPIADAMQSLLDALDAREADAKDAARYRWLREHGCAMPYFTAGVRAGPWLDAEIDAITKVPNEAM